MFHPSHPDAQTHSDRIEQWVRAQPRYTPDSIGNFLGKADPHLIAQAMVYGCTVVTWEAPRPKSTKVQIPDVCEGLNVDWMSPKEMLKKEKQHALLASIRERFNL